jgi:H+-transporting ATPase
MFIISGASSIIACVWPMSTPDGIDALGLGLEKPYLLALYIWIYCFVWWVIQDVIKVGLYRLIVRNNIFDYNSTGQLILPESTLEYIRNNRDKDMASATKPGGH